MTLELTKSFYRLYFVTSFYCVRFRRESKSSWTILYVRSPARGIQICSVDPKERDISAVMFNSCSKGIQSISQSARSTHHELEIKTLPLELRKFVLIVCVIEQLLFLFFFFFLKTTTRNLLTGNQWNCLNWRKSSNFRRQTRKEERNGWLCDGEIREADWPWNEHRDPDILGGIYDREFRILLS